MNIIPENIPLKALLMALSVVALSLVVANNSHADVCRSGYDVIYKTTTDEPYCVTSPTAEKLILRGWGYQVTMQDPMVMFGSVVDANNQFAADLYLQAVHDNDDNVFFSPWSIYSAFAIAYEGARANTADEIQKVFGLPADDVTRQTQFKSVNDSLNQNNTGYQLAVANALWQQTGFDIKPDYVDTAKKYYDSSVDSVDLASIDGITTINDWVYDKTEGNIDSIIPEPLPDGRLVIANAIYFNGTWSLPFDKNNTRDAEFWITNDQSVSVPMMVHGASLFNYADTGTAQVIELPYEGDRVSMLIILPDEIEGLASIEEYLSSSQIDIWKESLSYSRVEVHVPKFTLNTKYNLIPMLSELGIRDAFSPKHADFDGISEMAQLFVSGAVHKAFVDVNEVGTEAAAVTGIGIGVTSVQPAHPIFRADHPFLFVILDDDTGNILFLGRVTNPE